MDLKTLPNAKSFILPGGVLVFATSVLLHSGLVNMTGSMADSYYAASFGAGIVLAWRFHSTRVALALATLFLSERALVFFSGGHVVSSLAGQTTFALIAVLLPSNFVLFSALKERGFAANALRDRLTIIFLQSIVVAAMCRPDGGSRLLRFQFVDQRWLAWTKLPQVSFLAFSAALAVLAIRFISNRKPVESGFFWSLFATGVAFHFGALGRISTVYLATAALILLASVIETSYLMAYHDELTGVPARRAFNEALLALETPYAIAVVDIDHFKNFNDTYGHDTGDHVLRLVAARLARVTGGGKAYRCGGEEFSIIFTGLTAREAAHHLELLRESVERSTFRVRTQPDRRSTPRGPERRRNHSRKKPQKTKLLETIDPEVHVTVSMGVAEPTSSDEEVNDVIKTADEALYRAKANGRNRIEISAKAKKSSAAMAGKHVS